MYCEWKNIIEYIILYSFICAAQIPNGSIVTQTGKIYEKFTPFYTSAISHRIRRCDTHKLAHVASRLTLGCN